MTNTIEHLSYVAFHVGFGLLVCSAFAIDPTLYVAGGFLAAVLAPHIEGILR